MVPISRRPRRTRTTRRRAQRPDNYHENRHLWSLAGGGAVGVIAVLVALPVALAIFTIARHESDPATPTDSAPPPPGCRAPSPATPGAGQSRLPLRSLCELPPQAAQKWSTIQSGQRRTARDGIVFGNAGRPLPQEKPGYYHEYTVGTPQDVTHGAQRLITGQGGELYYTDDHDRTFVVVDPTATN